MTDLSSRRALLEAATPGPWTQPRPNVLGFNFKAITGDGAGEKNQPSGYTARTLREDAALIAQMHADYPVLLEIVEKAGPMARLPYPVSADERDQWHFRQQQLVAALARLPELEERT